MARHAYSASDGLRITAMIAFIIAISFSQLSACGDPVSDPEDPMSDPSDTAVSVVDR